MVKTDSVRRKQVALGDLKRLDSRTQLRHEVAALVLENTRESFMLTALIRDDGYTHPTYIREVKAMYPAVMFQRRPTNLDTRSGFMDVTEGMSNVEKNSAAADMMSRLIISWDVKDHEGKPVAVSPANLKRLHPDLFTRMKNIICYCVDGGDELPGESEIKEPKMQDFLDSLQKNSQSVSS